MPLIALRRRDSQIQVFADPVELVIVDIGSQAEGMV